MVQAGLISLLFLPTPVLGKTVRFNAFDNFGKTWEHKHAPVGVLVGRSCCFAPPVSRTMVLNYGSSVLEEMAMAHEIFGCCN